MISFKLKDEQEVVREITRMIIARGLLGYGRAELN